MSTIKTNQIQTITGNPILNSSGSIIQTVYVRSDAFTTFSAAASGNGTTVSALSASITPTSATNRIICNWVICGEVGSASDCVWLIHRNGALITTAGEEGRNSVSNNRWVGFAPTPYEPDFNSTPFSLSIQYSQIAGTTSIITYSPAIPYFSKGLIKFAVSTGSADLSGALKTWLTPRQTVASELCRWCVSMTCCAAILINSLQQV